MDNYQQKLFLLKEHLEKVLEDLKTQIPYWKDLKIDINKTKDSRYILLSDLMIGVNVKLVSMKYYEGEKTIKIERKYLMRSGNTSQFISEKDRRFTVKFKSDMNVEDNIKFYKREIEKLTYD